MTEPTKLVEAAEWLAENTDDFDNYYQEMADRLRRYPVTEKDEFYYQEVEEIGGFNHVLDIVFGENPQVQNDGLEGLKEAAMTKHTYFIHERAEHGFSRVRSWKNIMDGKPEWFEKEIARSELDALENSATSKEQNEYIEFLREIVEE
jgi:hypothetical protein